MIGIVRGEISPLTLCNYTAIFTSSSLHAAEVRVVLPSLVKKVYIRTVSLASVGSWLPKKVWRAHPSNVVAGGVNATRCVPEHCLRLSSFSSTFFFLLSFSSPPSLLEGEFGDVHAKLGKSMDGESHGGGGGVKGRVRSVCSKWSATR